MRKKILVTILMIGIVLAGSNILTYFLSNSEGESPIDFDYFNLQPIFIFEGNVFTKSNISIITELSRITLLQRTYVTNQSEGNITGFSATFFIYTIRKPINLTISWIFSRINLEGYLQPFLFGSDTKEILYEEEIPMLYILTYRKFNPLGYIDINNFKYLSANITVNIH